jgi:hypothetical protein
MTDEMEQEHIPELYSLRKAITHDNQNYWLERLANELPRFIAKAEDSVYPRNRHFNLDNLFCGPRHGIRTRSEAEWEEWCIQRWSIRHGIKNPKPVRKAWHRLVARQVPLETPDRRNLLTADLVGISEDGFPVIVELKKHTKQAPILGVILQALFYGIRLKQSWSYFFKEWCEILSKYNWPTVQSQPYRVHLVCAAPSEYWKHEFSPRFVPDLKLYFELKKALDSCGFPLSFVSLSKRTFNKVGFRVMAKPIDFIPTIF